MKSLYNIALTISENLLKVFGNFFGSKVHFFKDGQQQVFSRLNQCLQKDKPVIWFHVSSLGEYEQALPVMEAIKKEFGNHQIVLSFFSPSGYEIKKDKTPAGCVVYLPIDTRANAKKFIDTINPVMVFFTKYDLWPNYLYELQKRQIPVYLISGLFKTNHSFFKWSWLRQSLKAFHHFFVQDQVSKQALQDQGFENISITGDTRFDRVHQIAQQTDSLDFVKRFKNNQKLLVAGSTWPSDEKILVPYINTASHDFKTVIAPHEVDDAHVNGILKQLKKKAIRYTDIKAETDLSSYDVLILNTIGLLNKTYRYADIVYIGNGFGKSIHNIQEPAVYGVPIITGPHIQKFNEAVDLKKLGGLITVTDYNSLKKILDQLWQNDHLRTKKASTTKTYALKNIGATEKIIRYLKNQQ